MSGTLLLRLALEEEMLRGSSAKLWSSSAVATTTHADTKGLWVASSTPSRAGLRMRCKNHSPVSFFPDPQHFWMLVLDSLRDKERHCPSSTTLVPTT